MALDKSKVALGSSTPKEIRSGEAILKDLARVECDLSPESLTCDGEASRSEVNRKLVVLNRQKRELIAELGRTPTESELHAVLKNPMENFTI